MVQLFIDGGGFMWPILIIFIIGFVFVGERLYHLLKGLSSNEAFANDVAATLESSGVEAAKEECTQSLGPVSNLCFNALTVGIHIIQLIPSLAALSIELGESTTCHIGG